ncbi:GTP diphosphokinase [Saccharobesus litoralis]|uniref:GTP pyrophosphokinase n=1 Tax=Saccharobesus litoralis TaxID=2172099 RepID=A0A2S0VTP0_9ALTE|nr:GTP diphosphokinase [Saccharobesus litoralis]AWB67584.1 GTP diphosphokinase [Saccharobesus litoralis]
MVTVRHSHSKKNKTKTFSDWLEELYADDPDRRFAILSTYQFCENIVAEPNLLEQSREMVEILSELNMDAETISAAMIFPFWREKRISPKAVEDEFGIGAVKLIIGVDKMAAIRYLQNNLSTHISADHLDNVRRMLLAMVEDVRAIVIKLAACIIDLRLVKNADEETKVITAKEASTIYAPLANRLGIGQLKWEIEDYAFRYQHPQTYKQIASMLHEKRTDRADYIDNFVSTLQSRLNDMHIKGEVVGRPKHIYSIWKKMQKKDLPFERVYDVRAVRVLVDTLHECYAALGVVHTTWSAINKEFDDYIATPKSNGYQSIHTVVLGPQGKAVEIQIRTQQMHQDAELGVAAHWRYKEGSANGKQDSYQEKINWLRKLLQWQEDMSADDNLVDELRSQVFEDRVYVFTPKGQVIDLPNGSTPLDFAYYIHSNVGHCCIGAKVFGKIVPFTYTLQSGDQVEILTSKTANPSRDWLNPNLGYVKSSRARSKIHHWFKLQDKDKNREAGLELLEQEVNRYEMDIDELEPAIARFNVNTFDDLCAAVGGGDLRASQIINYIQSRNKRAKEEIDPRTFNRQTTSDNEEKSDSAIVVQGVGNLMSYLAKCCQPLPGDEITGYITQGNGISVHREDCEQLDKMLSQHPERQVEVTWGNAIQRGYRVSVRVMANDRSGLLRDVTTVLVNEKISVHGINSHTDDKTAVAGIDVDIDVNDLNRLGRVLTRLSQVDGVYSAKRLK